MQILRDTRNVVAQLSATITRRPSTNSWKFFISTCLYESGSTELCKQIQATRVFLAMSLHFEASRRLVVYNSDCFRNGEFAKVVAAHLQRIFKTKLVEKLFSVSAICKITSLPRSSIKKPFGKKSTISLAITSKNKMVKEKGSVSHPNSQNDIFRDECSPPWMSCPVSPAGELTRSSRKGAATNFRRVSERDSLPETDVSLSLLLSYFLLLRNVQHA